MGSLMIDHRPHCTEQVSAATETMTFANACCRVVFTSAVVCEPFTIQAVCKVVTIVEISYTTG